MPAPPRFLFFIASDSHLMLQAVQKERGDSGRTINGMAPDITTFWGDEGLSDLFWDKLTLQGLFAVSKTLIIRNTQAIPAATLRRLSTALNRAPDSVRTLLCLEVPFEKGKPKIAAHIQKLPCYVFAEKNNAVITIPALTQATLPRFIAAEAARLGVRLAPQTASLLATLLPPDAATVSSEMEKLALLADATGTIPHTAASLLEQSLDATNFDLLRFIQSPNSSHMAWRQLLEYEQSGESALFGFLSIITREARILWQLLCGEQPAMAPSLYGPKQALARSLGHAAVAKLWELSLAAEKRVKAGESSPEQSFDMLCAELMRLFHGYTFERPAKRRNDA